MKVNPRIVVLGSLNVDFVLRVAGMPKSGESLVGESYGQGLGGKGANQALAAAKLGARVMMAGKVGQDTYGDQWIDTLRGAGIDTRFVLRSSRTHTGTAWIMIEPSAQNRIITFPGANNEFSVSELELLQSPLSEADLLVLQLEIETSTTEAALRMAARLGIPVLLNPGPVSSKPLSAEFLSMVDCLTPNETEAEALTGIDIPTLAKAHKAALTLMESGVRRVALTLGERGVLLADADGVRHVPAFPVHAVDTVAAGDTFSGALAVKLCQGCSLDEAARFASAAAAIAVTRHGSMNSIPDLREVQSFLQSK